jgi:hypothetical protein
VLISTRFSLTYVKKCRYIPLNQLSKASDEHVHAILDAIATSQIRVLGTAERMAVYVWEMGIPAFVEAVRAHLDAGYLIFYKRITSPPPNCIFFQANVGRYPDSAEEDHDVYVEIRLSNGTFIIICDSHPHFDSIRLPK